MSTLLAAAVVYALSLGQASPSLPSDLEEEARAIDAMLIAPCCFTQQVSVHQSEAAHEVRRDVRARLAAGQTREQILDAYVARYGKPILAQPPAAGFDLTLYVLPLVMLIGSTGLVAVVLRRFTKAGASSRSGFADAGSFMVIGPDEQERLENELRDLD